jgi:hypothetical protein
MRRVLYLCVAVFAVSRAGSPGKPVPRYSIAAPQRYLSDKSQGVGRRGEIGNVDNV